jgi:hypothetical protein
MDKNKVSRIPSDSAIFWIALAFGYIFTMILTMVKDQWLTGEMPNVVFYATVPFISMLAGILTIFGLAKLIKTALSFRDMLAIIVGVNLVMQGVEIVLKLVYYLLWKYPGILYMALVIPGGFSLGVFGLVKWGGVKWWKATLLIFSELIVEFLTAMFLTSLPGFSTPGS